MTVNASVAAIAATSATVNVTLSDISSCDPKLIVSPSSQAISIGESGSFSVTAPNTVCTHQLRASTSGLTAQTPATVKVVPEAASITVGLFDSTGTTPVIEIAQGSGIKVKFTGSDKRSGYKPRKFTM
ncbi:hypothetical protein [Caedibacter taeniospiralis]|uniref:hypothetical protein n=1 Tax=Caedibacter taeniospiralis TaxID=28907 RepID=UPI0037C0451B